MQPSILVSKLEAQGVVTPFCQWIISYFKNRRRQVHMNQSFSTISHTNINAPQGCVPSMCFSQFTPMNTEQPGSSNTLMTPSLLPYSDLTKNICTLVQSRILLINATMTTLNWIHVVRNPRRGASIFALITLPLHLSLSGINLSSKWQHCKYLSINIQSDLKWSSHISRPTQCKKG